MAVSVLDPKTALIVVDLQKAIISIPVVHPSDEIVSRASALARAFRANGLPVVLVNVAGAAPGRTEQKRGSGRDFPAGWNDIIPELNQQPNDFLVTKRTWGAFTGTGLDEKLKESAITQVVIAGISTSIGVESTARNAYELGYNVTLAIDAMTDTNAEAHENSIQRIFPRLGETASARDIIDFLETHWG